MVVSYPLVYYTMQSAVGMAVACGVRDPRLAGRLLGQSFEVRNQDDIDEARNLLNSLDPSAHIRNGGEKPWQDQLVELRVPDSVRTGDFRAAESDFMRWEDLGLNANLAAMQLSFAKGLLWGLLETDRASEALVRDALESARLVERYPGVILSSRDPEQFKAENVLETLHGFVEMYEQERGSLPDVPRWLRNLPELAGRFD